MSKDKSPKDAEHDATRTYQEWADHRYDPGHYLGGNVAPHLDKSRLGRSARKKAGLLLGFIALMTSMAVVSSWQASVAAERVAWIALFTLKTAAAIRMYRSQPESSLGGLVY